MSPRKRSGRLSPCPGVPGIHLNAEYIVSMTATLGRHLRLCKKFHRLLCRSWSDRGPRACAKTCLGEVAMVKKWCPRTLCTACSSKKTVGCQRLLRRSCKVCLFPSSWARITSLCIGKTCELDNWDGHATVLHGDGVEFGAYGLPLRRNVCM